MVWSLRFRGVHRVIGLQGSEGLVGGFRVYWALHARPGVACKRCLLKFSVKGSKGCKG